MTRRIRPERSAGILLHPTSLPGRFGIGDLGPNAYGFVDLLARAGQTWWQVLPLGPTGYGDSPYASFSAFSGNPLLISPEALVQDGLITAAELDGLNFRADAVDYQHVQPFKDHLLGRAWEAFRGGAARHLREPFETFRHEHAYWLNDFALFMAVKSSRGGGDWRDWPSGLMLREPRVLAATAGELVAEIGRHQFAQFLFFRQWKALRTYARTRGVRLLGDAPIFVAADSVDVWAHPELFLLDEHRKPTVIAGVPPDYFSEDGQLWGNPLYDWPALKRTGYGWWVARLRALLELVDRVRLDHFRGFLAAWHVSAGAATAQVGEWVPGPGADLFTVLRRELGGLPLVAEDLGLITDDVHALRDALGIPGMCVLQFAFGGDPEFGFLPHMHTHDRVVYTGTHDNDTTRGWFEQLTEADKAKVRRYMPGIDADPSWEMIRAAWASVGDYAIAPLQDVFDLGSAARMNTPGRSEGNWSWRFTAGQVTASSLDRLGELTELYARKMPRPDPAPPADSRIESSR